MLVLNELGLDIIEAVLSKLDAHSLGIARAVCTQWHEAASSHAVIVAAARNSRCLLRRAELQGLVGRLSRAEVLQLPCRPFVTRRGHTCWLYTTESVETALALASARGRVPPIVWMQEATVHR